MLFVLAAWSAAVVIMLKGVFIGHKIMGKMVAFFCVNITSVSFFHLFDPNFGGKHSGLIFEHSYHIPRSEH